MLAPPRIFDALRSIGLNLYERKLWVALLARGVSTAGELSQITGVPRSRTYDTMESLAERGFIIIQTARPLKFIAIPPREALERVKKKIEDELKITLDRIDELLKSPTVKELDEMYKRGLKLVEPEELTGALKGKVSVTQQTVNMFKDAKSQINILTTPEGLNDLARAYLGLLKGVKKRGVNIRVASVVNEGCSDAIKALSGVAEVKSINEKEIPITGSFCTVDGKELIFSLTDSQVDPSQHLAIWSRSEHATENVFQPLFEVVWAKSKKVKVG
ncbi:MAG: helix-turn-helix domain-containing protein [Candidatus Aenigmarchaeota archaeon]|nr:helix-turn-helix domain-containing protein [Candidatus Aenigmarchaeota archaeon]